MKVISSKYRCECGEAPIVKHSENMVYWVDTENPYCYRMDLSTCSVEKIEVAGNFQAMGMHAGGGWLAQSPKELYLLDEQLNVVKSLGELLPQDSDCVLNDGVAGPDGCYYIGYYDPVNLTAKVGGVYRVNNDYSVELVLEGYAVPNGMAFSLDNSKFYLTEMFDSRILEFDFDVATGEISNQRTLITVDEEEIYPDGLIIDSEGFLWSGHWQGFRVVRYSPQGNVDHIVDVPMPTPTCMAILPGEELFITTATKGCSSEQIAEYPLSGTCITVKANAEGVRENIFIEK